MGVVVSLEGERDQRPSLDELHALIKDDLVAVKPSNVRTTGLLSRCIPSSSKNIKMKSQQAQALRNNRHRHHLKKEKKKKIYMNHAGPHPRILATQ